MDRIWKILKPHFRQLYRVIPKAKFLYVMCQKYIDDYNGENNSNMYVNGEYEFLKRNIERFHMIFDVGAGVGDWTRMALSLKSNLNIHCFEPNAFAYKKLVNNNFPDNVVCNNFGASSSKRKAKLFIFDEGSTLNSLYRRQGLEGLEPQKKEEIVHLDTLDNYCMQNKIRAIDFVKIDVEGHELEVLKGMKGLLKNKQVKIIQFEYGGCWIDADIFLKDMFEFFKKYNYDFYKIFPGTVKRIKYYSQELDNFQYKNFLIVQKGYQFNE